MRTLAVLQRQLDADPAAWRAALVARGDLQATFAFRGFEETRRLGLRRGTEAAVRAAAAAASIAAADGNSPCPLRLSDSCALILTLCGEVEVHSIFLPDACLPGRCC